MLHREFAIRFFDVLFAGVFGYTQRVVVIFFGHETASSVKVKERVPDAGKRNQGWALIPL